MIKGINVIEHCYPFAFPNHNIKNRKLIKVEVDASSELVFAQDLNHRLTEHCGEGGEAEGEAGGEDGLDAVHDEAVEAVQAVHGAQNHVQTADNDGGNTAEGKLRERMR